MPDPVLATIQVQVIAALRLTYDHRWRRTPVGGPDVRLYYGVAGAGFIEHGGERYQLTPGSLHLIPMRANGSFGLPQPRLVFHWVQLHATVLGGMPLYDYLAGRHSLSVGRETGDRFRALEQVLKRDRPDQPLLAAALALQLLAPFVATVDSPAQQRRQDDALRFRDVLAAVDRRLAAPPTVRELAALMGWSETHFSKMFHRTFGYSPTRYILRRRVEAVQRRLIETDRPLKGIAEELGFADEFHLSRTFKRVTGIAPRDYRRHRAAAGP
jgi:AraC-like DNA-binding protein